MKTLSKLICFLIIFPLYVSSYAQADHSAWVTADLGINSIWILNQNTYGNQEIEYGTKAGFSGSLSYRQLFEKFGYSAGIGVRQMGQNYAGEMAGADATRKLRFTYLEFPAMAMMKIRDSKQQSFLLVGPKLLYLISANQKFSRETGGRELINEAMLNTAEVKDRFNPVDVLLALEVNNTYAKSNRSKVIWTYSFSGGIGLLDINREKFQYPNIHENYEASRNFYFGISGGILFNVK